MKKMKDKILTIFKKTFVHYIQFKKYKKMKKMKDNKRTTETLYTHSNNIYEYI